MDTAMKTFIASPTVNSLLSLKRPELLDVDELNIVTEEVKLIYKYKSCYITNDLL